MSILGRVAKPGATLQPQCLLWVSTLVFGCKSFAK